MKKIVTLIAIALITITGTAQKFGHLNSQQLLTVMPDYKAAEAELTRYQDELSKELQMWANLIKGKEADLVKDQTSLTPEIRAQREKELQDSYQKFQEKQQEAELKLQEKEAALMQAIMAKIKKAVATVAKANGYTYIFEEGSLYYAGGDDISGLVKKELGIVETPAGTGTGSGGN